MGRTPPDSKASSNADAIALAETQATPRERSDETQDDTRSIKERESAARQVAGRYDVGRLLGEGGMGEVRECRDTVLERAVALKTIRRDRRGREIEARFVREAFVQAQLEHPSIVPVFEVGREEAAGAFFTMRKISGIPLGEIIERKRAGDPKMVTKQSELYGRHRLLTAFAEVCMTVHYAHSRGVLHRDLKPSNIMLGEFGEVYVLDWGVAKLAVAGGAATTEELPSRDASSPILPRSNLQTVAGTALGTPAYMAPEQLAATQEIDARADVFALGAVLFEILTLQPLLDDAAVEARLRGREATWEPRPSVRSPDQMVPPEFDRICARATAADPAKRYASARVLRDAVEAVLDGVRDDGLRTKLADGLLESAEEKKTSDRDAAFRDVNRALALAPEHPRGLALLVDLLNEAPTIPEKARQDVRVIDVFKRHQQAQPLGVILFTVPWVTFYPLMLLLHGVRSIPHAILPAAGWLLAGLANYIDFRRRTYADVIYPSVAIAIAIAVTTVIFGPLFIVPQLAATITAGMILISATKFRTAMITMACASVFLPMVLTWCGLIDSYRFESETTLVVTTLFQRVQPLDVIISLTTGDLLMLVGAAYFASKLRDEIEGARVTKVLYAWQLSKLLPPTSGADSKRSVQRRMTPPKDGIERLLDTEVDATPLRASEQTALTRPGGSSLDETAAPFPLLALDGSRYVRSELLVDDEATELHRVHDRLVGRDIAMKRPHREEATAFTHEALLQARIEHPSVPPIYDLGHDEQGPWFTMKLVRGTSLSEQLKAPRTPDKSELGRHQRLAAFAKVCLTIDFAHQHNVVHAALDSTKIVLGEFGEVYVLGWGQADGIVDKGIDVHALGAILLEIVHADPSSSRELRDICKKAMASDPKARYASARKVHDALESFLSSDRDEAIRRDLAVEHLARAEAGIEGAMKDVDARVDVLRDVGHALALAPDRGPALRLLSRLLATPPKQMPPPVLEETQRQVWAMSKRASRPGALTYVVLFLVVYPLYALTVGVRHTFVAIAIGLSWALAAAVLFGVYRFRQSEPRLPWVGITSALAVGLTTLLFGPYFIVPGLAVTVALAYILTVETKWRWPVVGLSALVIVIPVLLLWAGVPTAMSILPGDGPNATFVIEGAVRHPPNVFVGCLTLSNVLNVFFVGVYAGGFRDILDELEAENRAKVLALSRLM